MKLLEKPGNIQSLMKSMENKRDQITFHFSDALTNAVHSWIAAGRIKQVRKKASYVITRTAMFQYILRTMKESYQSNNVWCVNDLPWTISTEVYLFSAASEKEVLTLFENLIPKKSIESSERIILKMLCKRIQRLQSFVKAYNDQNKNKINLQNSYTVKELTTLFMKRLSGSKYWNDLFEKINNQFKEVINKPKFNEQLLKDAWSLTLVKEIHDK